MDEKNTSSPEWEKGYVQVYTGAGKGKSTAAFGLALRAAGAGLKVYIGQFVKGMRYSEVGALEKFAENIEFKQFGRGCFIRNEPTKEDVAVARAGLCEVRKKIESGEYNLVILEEANIAVHYNLFSIDDLLSLIDDKPDHVELIVTGRRAHPRLIERADLVTEMREIKHYYKQGVPARVGIER